MKAKQGQKYIEEKTLDKLLLKRKSRSFFFSEVISVKIKLQVAVKMNPPKNTKIVRGSIVKTEA